MYTGKVAHWLRIAFPDMVSEPPMAGGVEVVPVEAPTRATRVAPVADIGAVALGRFEERRAGILIKTLARLKNNLNAGKGILKIIMNKDLSLHEEIGYKS